MTNPPSKRVAPYYPRRPSARESILASWRGINLTSLEQNRRAVAKAAGGVMPHVLKDLGLEGRLSEATIMKVWNDLIDPIITSHARPVRLLRNGTLVVTVDHSVWLDEVVRYRRHEILERLQHSFGRDLITRISFRAG
jgi:predicted nucleic acid-binding Zn ribbon protein